MRVQLNAVLKEAQAADALQVSPKVRRLRLPDHSAFNVQKRRNQAIWRSYLNTKY